MLEKFLRTIAALQQIDHVPQPRQSVVRRIVIDMLAVAPVCSDTPLRNVVHFLRADLHLHALHFRADDGGMNGGG